MKKQLIFIAVFMCLASITMQAQQRKVLFEQFTSSTCSPCASMNTWLTPLLQNNAEKVVVVKYQMNWPGSGDPYYTAEGGTRRGYYGVNAVPAPFTNGVSTNSQSAIQNAINNGYAKPTEATITGTFKVTGNTIAINGSVTPLISGDGYKIHVIANEKTTTKNKGGNGETAFHHVMMKMFPDGNGTDVTLTEGTTIPINFTFDMSTTNVEEMYDLEVAVFVQNTSTKTILNAAYLEDITPPAPENVKANQNEIGKPDVTIAWEPPVRANVEGYNIYRDNVKINTSLLTGNSYKDIAPEYGKTFTYSVSAMIDGEEGYWKQDTVLIKVTVPVPTNVKVEQIEGLKVRVSWDKHETDYPVKYYIYRNALIQNSGNPTSDTTFENTLLVFDKEYCFQVVPIVNEIKGKQSDKACITVTEVPILETSKGALFSIFPNPVSGTLNINAREPITDCQIFNIQGQIIYSSKSNIKEITIGSWDSGIYIISITTEKGSAEKRFIKK